LSRSERGGFSRKTLGWIIGLSVGSFVLAIVLMAFADDLGEPVSAGADAFSRSAIGHRAALELLRRTGVEVVVRQSERPPRLDPETLLLLAEPFTLAGIEPPSEDELLGEEGAPSRLESAVWLAGEQSAPLALVLPKRTGVPSPYNPRFVADVLPVSHSAIRDTLDALGPAAAGLDIVRPRQTTELRCRTSRSEELRVSLNRPQLLEPSDRLEPVVTCAGNILVARLLEDGNAAGSFIVSDPDLFNNQGLGKSDNARLFHATVTGSLGASRVVVDETIHGFLRNSGMLAELFGFPLVLVLGHGVLVLGLVLWAGLGRFGKPLAPAPALGSGKEVLIDNTAKLMNVARQTARILPRYFEQTVRTVAAHYYLPADLPEPVLLSRLQKIGNARGLDFDLAKARKEATRLAGRKHRPHEAVKLAQRLHRFRQEMLDVG
jgi:hypothetical protein